MGLYVNKKIGFVFELQESTKNTKIFKTIKSCSNEDCICYDKQIINESKFCQECGSKISEKTLEEGFSFPSCYEFCEEHLDGDEVVAIDNGGLPDNIWLYNYFITDPELLPYISNEDEDEQFIDITNIDIDKLIKRFNEIPEIKNFMEKFESVYGKDSIKIKYAMYKTIY